MNNLLYNAVDFDANRELIKIEAEGIAKRHGLDLGRIMSIYERCSDIGWLAPVPAPFETNLDRAIAIIGKEKALKLFESEDLSRLAERISLVDDINLFGDIPLYSLDELASLTQEFIQYLLNNRRHLLNTGYPSTKFNQSPWLEKKLSNLYHLNFPTGIKSPMAADQSRLKGVRHKLFDLKIKILNELLRYAKLSNPINPWEKCLRLLTGAISAEEAEFYLRMDQFYTGHEVKDEGSSEEIPGLDRAGGLTDFLEVIGHYEKEIVIGTLAITRNALGDFLQLDETNRPALGVSNYFEAVDHPLREGLDSALDLFFSFASKERDFWEKYRNRVNQALRNEFYDEVVTGVKIKRALVHLFEPQIKTLSALLKSHLETTGKLPRVSISNSEETRDDDEFVFRKENDFWTLIYNGQKPSLLKDENGLRYIAYLLGIPNKKVHVLQLYHLDKIDNGSSAINIRKMSKEELHKENLKISVFDDAGGSIDPKAVAQYKNSLKDFREEYDRADRDNDIGRKEIIDHEIHKLEDILASSLGLGGRIRADADPNERARSAVTNSIRHSRDKIKLIDENLWRHLFHHIRTGRYCSYTPEKPIPWKI